MVCCESCFKLRHKIRIRKETGSNLYNILKFQLGTHILLVFLQVYLTEIKFKHIKYEYQCRVRVFLSSSLMTTFTKKGLHVLGGASPWRIGYKHGLVVLSSRLRIQVEVSDGRTNFPFMKRFYRHPRYELLV